MEISLPKGLGVLFDEFCSERGVEAECVGAGGGTAEFVIAGADVLAAFRDYVAAVIDAAPRGTDDA